MLNAYGETGILELRRSLVMQRWMVSTTFVLLLLLPRPVWAQGERADVWNTPAEALFEYDY